jgi:hypothetical protein
MIPTGKEGALRIYDSSAILHGAAPRDDATPDIVKWDGAAAWTNITSDVDTDDASFSSAFLTDNDDGVFIGSDVMFAMIDYLKGAGANYAVASGVLKLYYFDGTDFSKSITVFVDGTASGGDCFAKDGKISFMIPPDWSVGANVVNAALDADKYYVKLMTTTSPTTDPDADVLCPCDGQFFEVAFAGMDFSGPFGRALQDEILVLNRMKMDSKAHYRKGADDKIYEALPLSFSCLIDDTHNKDDLKISLACGDPDSTRWTATGVSSKGDTKNDGINFNPAFVDTSKKTVNVQILWDTQRTGAIPVGLAYYEVYFPPVEQSITEADEGNAVSCNGGIFGVIEDIHGFGNRY